MPLSASLIGHVTCPHRIVRRSAAIGSAFFLLFIGIALLIISHRRSESHDLLADYTQSYVLSVLTELQQTLLPLRSMTEGSCDQVRNGLTLHAAFSASIRTIMLVKNNIAFCSSATGPMQMAVNKISADIDVGKTLDIRLVPGTPMMPGKPAIVMWLEDPAQPGSGILASLNLNLIPYLLLASRQQEINGMAITIGDKAITTWDQRLIARSSLPQTPLRSVAIPGYPVGLYLYGTPVAVRDIHTILLVALLAGVLITCGCFLLFTLRLRPGKEILRGIQRGEFYVEYQPLIEASSGRPYAVEALLRWTHPTLGQIPPDAFISYAEGQQMIVALTRHLFKLVARDAHVMRHALPAGTQLGINLSANHLISPGFRQDVGEWLNAMPTDYFSYIFEITERAMVTEQCAYKIFDWIRQQNIKIAIDDFGTGHSALIYLERFKFDSLKIDRGFVQSIGMETVNSPVLDAVLTLAKKLNLNTVAEGVETAEQALWLLDRGINAMQGYLFSHPRTLDQLIDYFANGPCAGGASHVGWPADREWVNS